ncbi:hypothetical protein [Portibacter lacus]|uniref:Uncharacterized protein n=1 Tax=Portibacter lacus TaxID=1099794 RepID=A0AA37WG29_9BACT|nr:hypothetical protein [Portibacter lacus]GLR19378.1 hypothetical protein GCM10007940_39940 [Portibacter lacus]
MKNLIFVLAILGVAIVPGCKKTCENVKVGETTLAEETLNYLNYNKGDVVVFESSNGEDITFTVDRTDDIYFICQKVTCDPIDPYKSSFCEYVEAPITSIFLQSDSTLLGIEASVYAYEPETELFFDAVRFTISHVNDSAIASKVTNVKFTNPVFKQDEVTDIDDFVEERSSVEIENKTLENVLICKDSKVALYYQKGKGFAAFTIGNRDYFLKE